MAPPHTRYDLRGVRCYGRDKALAAGEGLLVLEAGSWREVDTGGGLSLWGVGGDFSDAWLASASQPVLAHFDGTKVTRQDIPMDRARAFFTWSTGPGPVTGPVTGKILGFGEGVMRLIP